MGAINILSKRVCNLIAAGQVVDRPASVVKELVENSIDAGATNITIEIEKGGQKLIKVSDNGIGMTLEDMRLCFKSHTTSKIEKEEDLLSIETLGFRGEALSSICAVSQMEIISQFRNSGLGNRIVIDGGETVEEMPTSAPDGTIIIVKNLFYNTPARLKFLKSQRSEEGAINNLVNKLMLSNPQIVFKYIVDGKIVYNTFLRGLKERIYDVYGGEIVKNLVYVEEENEEYKLYGYIAKPTFSKSNRSYETTIINGRIISCTIFHTAAENAFSNFMMRGQYPIYILNLDLPYEHIDINVTPDKTEARFKFANDMYDFIYNAVFSKLSQTNFVVDVTNDNKAIEEDLLLNEEFPTGLSYAVKKDNKLDTTRIELNTTPTLATLRSPTFEEEEIKKIDQKSFDIDDKGKIREINEEMKLFSQENITFSPLKSLFRNGGPMQLEIDNLVHYRKVGTLFKTYLFIEIDDNLYIFDQHAGHERILYDKLMKDFSTKKVNSQPLMIPFMFDVNEEERELLENNLNVLRELGFGIELFGRLSYKISYVPECLVGINLVEFVQEILSDLTKISPNNEQIRHFFATIACKAAVKGGDDLQDFEIDALMKQVLKSDRILLCPHGRPICIKLTKTEIEKMFKRKL